LPQEVLGFGLGWWNDVVAYLRSSLPVIAVLAGLPQETLSFGLGWSSGIVAFLRGSFLVIAAYTGLIMVFIGLYWIWWKIIPRRKVVVKK
jgi:hypothetical protein